MEHSHQNLEKMSSTAPMLPKDDDKIVVITPANGGKILIREDTILANIQGCAGCGRTPFNCGVQKNWTALCWGDISERKYYTLLVTLSATFVLSFIGTVFFCFTNTINDAILSSMVIRNNSLAFSMWKKPTVNPLMKVHIFNYTNWLRVRDGYDDELQVEDVGPYVYSQQLERVNVKFSGDKLTFQERNTFRFIPEKSTGVHYDQIVVPNLPLLGVISKAIDINLNNVMQFSLNSALHWANHPDAFVKLPVHRFLWGYDDTIISIAKPILSLQGQLRFDQFGLLATKNGTVSDLFTINTGENDKDKMNLIETLNGQEKLSFWGTPECNSLEASDGSIFPPSMLDKKRVLQVFYPNLCRRIPFIYEKDVETEDGVQLLRFRMPENVFDDPVNNPNNQCYCEMDSGVCPPKGVINVTACAMGAPALASFPHFLRGAPHLHDDVKGMNPDPSIHENYLDIHPTLGLSLRGKSSLQINIQVRKTDMFSAVGFLKQGLILPVAWLDMSVEELPEGLRSLIYHGTYSTAAAQLGLAIVCVIALIVSGLCLFFIFVCRRKKPCATLIKVPVGTELNNTIK